MGNTRLLVVMFACAACSGPTTANIAKPSCGSPDEPAAVAPFDWDATQAAARAWPMCTYQPGDLTTKTIGTPPPSMTIPSTIKHVIVLLRENHSFDNYLGEYRSATGSTVDGAGSDSWNPDPSDPDTPNAPVYRYHETRYCIADTDHEWSPSHLEYDNGRMDGFVAANNNSATGRGGARAMGYYDRSDLPFYYWLADNFAISDRYFSAYLGPTHSNIMFYFKATSCGYAEGIDTQPNLALDCGASKPTIFSELDDKGVQYKVYSDNSPPIGAAAVLFRVYDPTKGVGSIDDFVSDAAKDKLPSVVFVEPNYGKIPYETEDDEHPPTNIQVGQRMAWKVITGLMASPSWQSSILFVTWDEHGGYYDHYAPPHACDPGGYMQYDFKFDRYDFRVPLFAVSQYSKPGYVGHIFSDHTSIVRFIEYWQGLPAMTARDANAWPLLDMFDFTTARSITLPDSTIADGSTDPGHVASCNGTGGPGEPP